MASIWQNNKLLRKWEQKNFKKSTCIFICVYFFCVNFYNKKTYLEVS